jgi:hypothetical protein
MQLPLRRTLVLQHKKEGFIFFGKNGVLKFHELPKVAIKVLHQGNADPETAVLIIFSLKQRCLLIILQPGTNKVVSTVAHSTSVLSCRR